MDRRDDERLTQDFDHRDRCADARLEAKLHAGVRGGGEELGAATGDELLVRGDDGLPGGEKVEHVAARRVEAAHDLRDDRDGRIVANGGEVSRQDLRLGRGRTLLLGIAHERPDDAEPVPRRALDVLPVLA